jgi:WD40 repeat protein
MRRRTFPFPTQRFVHDQRRTFTLDPRDPLQKNSKDARNPLARWSIGSGSLNEFAFSPDQHLLAVVSQDGFLRVFHYEKMELITYMKSYFGGLLCVCIRSVTNREMFIVIAGLLVTGWKIFSHGWRR